MSRPKEIGDVASRELAAGFTIVIILVTLVYSIILSTQIGELKKVMITNSHIMVYRDIDSGHVSGALEQWSRYGDLITYDILPTVKSASRFDLVLLLKGDGQ